MRIIWLHIQFYIVNVDVDTICTELHWDIPVLLYGTMSIGE